MAGLVGARKYEVDAAVEAMTADAAGLCFAVYGMDSCEMLSF